MKLTVSRVLHAGYVFESDSTKILFDPIFENPFSQNCFAFPHVHFDLKAIRRLKFDAVLISHYHDDHLSFESLDLFERTTPIYLYSVHEEHFALLCELGFVNVQALRIDVVFKIGDIEVTPRLALDPETDAVFQIQHGDIKILNVVDAWINPSALEKLAMLAPWDLVLWPFQTLREIAVLSPETAEDGERSVPPEWIEQLERLRPRIVVPSSCQFIHEAWSWYNRAMFPITYAQFARDVLTRLPGTEVMRMNPSVSLLITKIEGWDDKTSFEPSVPLPWVLPLGVQDVDYEYDPKFRPDTTENIAQQFAALTPSEKARVTDFCSRELGKKQTKQFPDGAAATWRLSVFDHLGQVIVFTYPHAVDWETEVPIAKLYAALENGEALTSMYLRIKHREFDGLDVLDDPLVKSLFDGKVASYQRAQLRKLRLGKEPTSL